MTQVANLSEMEWRLHSGKLLCSVIPQQSLSEWERESVWCYQIGAASLQKYLIKYKNNHQTTTVNHIKVSKLFSFLNKKTKMLKILFLKIIVLSKE